ncbi:tryptophan--tRNA ligase [archaeon]|nr:tryptophan--tRNA ligase [archaeon]
MEKNIHTIVTGDRPTGKLHLGHYFGSLNTRLQLQNQHNMFILIADTQVLNNDISKSKQVKENTLELMRDYLAIGLNPNKVHFFLQSQISELFELSNYFANIVTLPQVQRIPTIKSENEIYNSSLNMGFLNYPISQTADIVLLGGDLVPVGIDQLPILEFGNDVINRFHHLFKCKIFKHITPLLSTTPKIMGIDGKNKMSKGLDNSIFLSDESQNIHTKVFQMFTDPGHIKVSDPGKVEGNVVFQFLDLMHEDKNKITTLKEQYTKGGLGDVMLKKLLVTDIDTFLEPIRYARKTYSNNYLLDVLNEGTKFTKLISKDNMTKIKDIIFN